MRVSADGLRSLLDTAGTIIVGLRPDHTIFDWNEGAYRTFGYMPEEMLGKNFLSAILPPSQQSRMAAEIEKALAGEVIRTLETPGIECNQETSVVLWNMTRVVDESGSVSGVLAIGQDVTERARAARVVEEARQAAEAANKARGDFLANMSHEIRTPLSGILGMTELVLDSPLTPEQRARLNAARRAAEDLLTLVNDVLDFSRIDAGKLDLHPEDFALRDSLAASWRLFGARAARKGLDFTVRIAPDVPDFVCSDALRLRQVVNNLLDNAIKFTERGGITVTVTVRPAPGGAPSPANPGVEFVVSDTGCGIPFDKQACIFEVFRQADSSITRHYGGTGLGLAICHRLVGLLGGELWVESAPAAGSKFHFTANFRPATTTPPKPMPIVDPQEAEMAAANAGAGAAVGHEGGARSRAVRELDVWVAEDNPVNRELIRAHLDALGHRVTEFPDGRQLLIGLAAALREPDVILMDLQMPNLDGLETARAIRHGEHAQSREGPTFVGAFPADSADSADSAAPVRTRLPIVALTAHARLEDREAALAAGVDDYLVKPVRRTELEAALCRVTGVRERGNSRVKPAGPAGSGPGATAAGVEPGSSAFDREGLLAELSGDLPRLHRLARTYLEHTPGVRAALREARVGGQPDGIRRAAHTLFGSLALLQATGAAELARRLHQSTTLDDEARCHSTIESLEIELDRLESALRDEVGWTRSR